MPGSHSLLGELLRTPCMRTSENAQKAKFAEREFYEVQEQTSNSASQPKNQHTVRSPQMPYRPTRIGKMKGISTTQIFGYHCLMSAYTSALQGAAAVLTYASRMGLGRRGT
jgi:hypothetical protein